MSFLEYVGRYRIRQPLGQGGMATVYLAHDPNMNREVAVKVLSAALTVDREFAARFQREAEVIAALEHEAIVPLYDFGVENDQPYMVMRYMPGGTLNDRLQRGGPMSVSDVAVALERVCEALGFAHERGIVHRDIKPANVLFDQHGETFLSDFGIVKVAGESGDLTRGNIVGTAAYISPEQVYGDIKISHLADIYSLGVMLFELLAGRRPYKAESPTKLMMKHVLDPIPNVLEDRPDLPETIAEVIYTAMAKSPASRYQSAADFLAALQSVGRVIPSRRARRKGSTDKLFDALGGLDEGAEGQ